MTTSQIEQVYCEDRVEPFVDIQEIIEATGMSYEERLEEFLTWYKK